MILVGLGMVCAAFFILLAVTLFTADEEVKKDD